MNKKGFTLAELLAVVAILAIIILVAVPTFNKYVLNSENEYYKTLEKTVKTAGMEYMSENSMFLPHDIGHYSTVNKENLLASGIIENVTDSEGNACERVEVVVKKNTDSNYEYETCLKCGNYETDTPVCRGEYDDWGEGEDKTGPDITDIYVSNKTTNSITINAICKDEESGIKEYLYSKDGGKTYVSGGTNSSYKFDNLIANSNYSFKVKCISNNKIGSNRESKEITALTARFTNPTIKQVQTSDGYPKAGYAYSPKRAIQATYNSYNIEGPMYFVMSTVDVSTNVKVYQCSGGLNSLNQKSCSTTPTYQMTKNIWYRTEGLNTTATFSTNTNTGNHTLYAQIGDGVNLSGITSYIVTNIDISTPTIYSYTNPKTLGQEYYNFISNIGYSYGFSGGKVTCNPPTSLKTGTYNVTCTAIGNNSLTTSTTFLVKHNYQATFNRKTCTRQEYAGQVWVCHGESVSCDPWICDSCWGSQVCSVNCGWQYFGSTCCTGWEGFVDSYRTVEYDCSYYTCPDGGTLNGNICYY